MPRARKLDRDDFVIASHESMQSTCESDPNEEVPKTGLEFTYNSVQIKVNGMEVTLFNYLEACLVMQGLHIYVTTDGKGLENSWYVQYKRLKVGVGSVSRI